VPENRSLKNSTIPVTEGNNTHPIDEPLESSYSGEPGSRLTENDDEDARPVAEDNTTYCIDVPLADSFHCKIRALTPKWYKRHGDLTEHTKRYHARRLVFRCHGCSKVFAILKGCKRHQTSTDCGKLPVTTWSPSQPPLSQQPNTLQVRRCRLPTPAPKEQPTTAPETRNTSTSNEQIENNFIFVDQAHNNDQASNIQALESDSVTQMVNPEDSNSHTLTQLASEAVTNTPQSAIPEIDPNMNRNDSTNNELGSELATEGLHSPSDWQKKWIHRFNNIADSIQLEENLTEFIEEAKITHQRSEAPQTQTRGEPPPRRPQQIHHRQRKQHRRQEKQ